MRTDKSVGADQGRNFPVGLREFFRGKVKGAESRWWDSRAAPWRAGGAPAWTDGHLEGTLCPLCSQHCARFSLGTSHLTQDFGSSAEW